MTTAVNLIIAATVLASIYGLINVGFVLLYRTTGVINFAQGHFMLLGAFLMWALTQVLPYGISLIITVLAAFETFTLLRSAGYTVLPLLGVVLAICVVIDAAAPSELRGSGVLLAAVLPLMLILTLTVLMLQLRSFSNLFLVLSVAPLLADAINQARFGGEAQTTRYAFAPNSRTFDDLGKSKATAAAGSLLCVDECHVWGDGCVLYYFPDIEFIVGHFSARTGKPDVFIRGCSH